jgi:lambda family phage portal protein
MRPAIPEFDSPRTAVAVREAPPRMTLAMSARNEMGSTTSAGAQYEGGAHTRRTHGWRAPSTTANSGVLANLTTLRDRSRATTRNDGYGKSAIDKLVTNIIGTGIKPMSLAADKGFREKVQQLWTDWTDECDADGLFDFYGLQALATRCWLDGGDAFTRLRPRMPGDGLRVPLQLQVLEPELCPHTHHVFTSTTKIRAGIEFNGIGKRVAYYFHPSRPELDDFDASQLRRVSADAVCHLYLPLRAGQIRGIPQLTAALVTLMGANKFADATLLRQHLANLFVAVVKRPSLTGGAEEFHPLTGAAPTAADDGDSMIAMEPGITQELAPGEEMEFSDPPGPNGFAEFMRETLMQACVAAGVPYEVVTGDMRGVNDRTVRVLLHEFRRYVQMLQHQVVVYQFCRPIWRAFMDRVFLSGALPIPMEYLNDPMPWARVKWVPQGWPYLHPVQDVEAAKAAVRSGFRSRAAVVSELGEDVEVIDREQAEDNQRADGLGLKHDSDGRTKGAPANSASRPRENDDDNDPAREEQGQNAGASQ